MEKPSVKTTQKLTLAQAESIKYLLWHGTPQDVIAARFGVTQPTISRIAHGHTYKMAKWPDGSIGRYSGFPQYNRDSMGIPKHLPEYDLEGGSQEPPSEAELSDADKESLASLDALLRQNVEKKIEESRQRDDIVSSMDSILEEDLATAGMFVDTVKEEAVDGVTPVKRAKTIPWDTLVVKAKTHPLIVAGKEKKNTKYRPIICQTFAETSEDKWGSASLFQLFAKLCKLDGLVPEELLLLSGPKEG